MISKLMNEALLAHEFVKVYANDGTGFYIRQSGEAIRFAILHRLDTLVAPLEINAAINQMVPDEFSGNPTFKKNCDLICIHHLDKLADFKGREEQIFAIEEDAHYFKKYVLYYSDTEEGAVEGFTFDKLVATLSDKNLFSQYKNEPLAATQYSVAAKIFIKLPFLELPVKTGELVSLRQQAEETVAEADLNETYEIVQKLSKDNMDDLIKELMSNELENIPD